MRRQEPLYDTLTSGAEAAWSSSKILSHFASCKRGRFLESADMKRAKHELLVHANPLKGFIDECCVVDPRGRIALQVFYDAYCEWATQSGYSFKGSSWNLPKILR